MYINEEIAPTPARTIFYPTWRFNLSFVRYWDTVSSKISIYVHKNREKTFNNQELSLLFYRKPRIFKHTINIATST